MSDNTITESTGTFTPERLREALDLWCKDQPKVLRLMPAAEGTYRGYEAFICDEGSDPNWFCIADETLDQPETKDQLETKHYETFLALTALAIEHQYTPWLELAASLPYTGQKAAQLALRVLQSPSMGESTDVPEVSLKTMASTLGQVSQIDDKVTIKPTAKVPPMQPYDGFMADDGAQGWD